MFNWFHKKKKIEKFFPYVKLWESTIISPRVISLWSMLNFERWLKIEKFTPDANDGCKVMTIPHMRGSSELKDGLKLGMETSL